MITITSLNEEDNTILNGIVKAIANGGYCEAEGWTESHAKVLPEAEDKLENFLNTKIDDMRKLVINRIVDGHIEHRLDEWPSGLRDSLNIDDQLHIEARGIRDRANANEIRAFLKKRNNEELLAMYTQQDCQNFR